MLKYLFKTIFSIFITFYLPNVVFKSYSFNQILFLKTNCNDNLDNIINLLSDLEVIAPNSINFDKLSSIQIKILKDKIDKNSIPPIIKTVRPKMDYLELIKDKNIKPSKCVLNATLPNPEQTCPKCGSPYHYHSRHSHNQKKCKCCNYHFTINPIREHYSKINNLRCPFCSRKLVLKHERNGFDVYSCRNKNCPCKKFMKMFATNHNDKTSYTYKQLNLVIDDILEIINNSNLNDSFNFRFRKFSLDFISIVITLHVNFQLSLRKSATAMKDLFGVNISHEQVRELAQKIAHIASVFNANSPIIPSDKLVADETYIKINGLNHYVWIVYDYVNESVISYHISSERDAIACATALVKAIKKYPSLPKSIKFVSDKYTAYPTAVDFVKKHYGINIDHFTVKGLKSEPNEDYESRCAKQKIERLNRTYKENYKFTTGYKTLKGARASFELWMLYYNFLRLKKKTKEPPKYINSIDFINPKIDFSDKTMQFKWGMIINYTRTKLSS